MRDLEHPDITRTLNCRTVNCSLKAILKIISLNNLVGFIKQQINWRCLMADDLLLEVLKLRKEVAELRAIVTEKDRSSRVIASGLEGRITAFLHELKIPTNLKGFSMIREAVKQYYENPDLTGTFHKELYPLIAEKFGSTPSRVERAIRHAIETCWYKNKFHPFFQTHFASKPTNTEMVAVITDELMLEEKYLMEATK